MCESMADLVVARLLNYSCLLLVAQPSRTASDVHMSANMIFLGSE